MPSRPVSRAAGTHDLRCSMRAHPAGPASSQLPEHLQLKPEFLIRTLEGDGERGHRLLDAGDAAKEGQHIVFQRQYLRSTSTAVPRSLTRPACNCMRTQVSLAAADTLNLTSHIRNNTNQGLTA